MENKYPDSPETHGILWTGISNATPGLKTLAEPPQALQNMPFDPLEFIEHLDELTFDPSLAKNING